MAAEDTGKKDMAPGATANGTGDSSTVVIPPHHYSHFVEEHPKLKPVENFIDEFKAFALKGNVVDLAVGVVIGTAFNAVVNSLVTDIIMGAIAQEFGKPNFAAFAYGAVKYGNFINNVLNFLIVALSVFVALKFVNRITHHKIATLDPNAPAK